jgi:homoserine dehydrogenase
MTQSTPHNFRIAIAGLGTVGAGVANLLQRNKALLESRCNATLSLVAVSARTQTPERKTAAGDAEWVNDPLHLATRDDVDIVIETIGGAEGVARELVETALRNGKHVITANKALIARHGIALSQLAEAHGVQITMEAAVAGGIPILTALRTGLAANQFRRIAGILNGTCNYILTTMQHTQRAFVDVLADAQAKGYAEADPAFDIDGVDAAHKLAILATLAFGSPVAMDSVHIEGIRSITERDIAYAAELGYRIRLLGIASAEQHGGDEAISARVYPCLVPQESPLALTEGVFNAVQVEGDAVGRIFMQGRGAGADPTASAVVSDIIAIARGERWPLFTRASHQLRALPVMPMAQHHCCYYIRLSVADEPGVLADVTRIFADEQISVQSIIQHQHNEATPAQVVITTHQTLEASMQRALTKIGTMNRVKEPPMMLRMEMV